VIRPVVAALVPSAGSAKIGAWHKRLCNPPILSFSNSGLAAPSLFKLGLFTSDLTGHGIPRVFYQANKMLGVAISTAFEVAFPKMSGTRIANRVAIG
jgi:hypothetical protein